MFFITTARCPLVTFPLKQSPPDGGLRGLWNELAFLLNVVPSFFGNLLLSWEYPQQKQIHLVNWCSLSCHEWAAPTTTGSFLGLRQWYFLIAAEVYKIQLTQYNFQWNQLTCLHLPEPDERRGVQSRCLKYLPPSAPPRFPWIFPCSAPRSPKVLEKHHLNPLSGIWRPAHR